jgi:hypothetical protein
MGTDLGGLYTALTTELIWLHWRWHQYVTLYATRDSRFDLMNSSAPFFFWIIQRVLWDDTLLGIARLAGPESTGPWQNLSLWRIPSLVEDPGLKQEISDRLAAVKENTDFAVKWRNKHLAHRDLDLSLGRKAEPLPEATKESVNAALSSMSALLNCVQAHYLDSTTAYKFSAPIGDAEQLLYVVRDGLRRAEIRNRHLEDEDYTYKPEDWNDDLPAV